MAKQETKPNVPEQEVPQQVEETKPLVFRATQNEMSEYAQIIQELTVLDLRRNETLKKLQEWEQAHTE